MGALYVRRRPRVRIEAQMSGGGQERGLRSGTLPAPLIVGLGEACAIAMREMDFDYQHVNRLANRLIDGINMQMENVVRNGDPKMWYPGIFCVLYSSSQLLVLQFIKYFDRLRKSVFCVR